MESAVKLSMWDGRRVAAAVLLAVVVGVWGVLGLTLGLMPATLLIVSLLVVATLPGAAIVKRLFNRPGLLYYLVLGTVFGLGLWAMGGMVSHLTGVFLTRWIPSLLALILWVLPRSKKMLVGNDDGSLGARVLRLPVHGVVGAGLALIALVPTLKTVLQSQPVKWDGWYQFYPDLNFHVAIAGEVAARAPQENPWVSDVVLSYPWLFHSSMGLWSNVSGATAADIVLQAWPVLFAILIPLLIAIVGWELSRSRFVALSAPLAYVLAHGLVISPATFVQVPLFQISPTRDFANLFFLVAVLSMSQLIGRVPATKFGNWWLLALAMSTFVAVASKGSEPPILLGGILSAGLFLIVKRRVRRQDFVALGVFLIGVSAGTVLVLPEPGMANLSWGPLTFLDANLPDRAVVSLVLLALLALAIFGLWLVIGSEESAGWLVASLLAGVMLAGLLGLGLLTHPGYSQNYFWQSVQPVFSIAIVWAALILWRRHGVTLIGTSLAIFFSAQVLSSLTAKLWVVGVGILVSAVVAAVALSKRHDPSGKTTQSSTAMRIGMVLALAGLLSQSAQLVSVPTGAVGGWHSTEDNSEAIHDSQLAAFEFIREHSLPSDIIISNKHCATGSIEDGTCLPNWFALSAWSERRVIVEGWGYTQKGTSTNWADDRLTLSDGFIESPTKAERTNLISSGVTFVYVDKREAFATNLGAFANLVFQSTWANVYSLKE